MSTSRKETQREVDGAALKRALFQPPKWWPQASCRGMSADVFSVMPVGGVAHSEPTGEEEAKAICAACPVRSLCRDWALSTQPAPAGIWGGMNEIARAEVRSGRRNLRAVS